MKNDENRVQEIQQDGTLFDRNTLHTF